MNECFVYKYDLTSFMLYLGIWEIKTHYYYYCFMKHALRLQVITKIGYQREQTQLLIVNLMGTIAWQNQILS